MRYNPPPTWPPPPPGWQPPPGWRPPTEWGPPPPGWPLWVKVPVERPSVWSTIGIALASAVLLGLPLGLLLAPPGGEVAYWMGTGVGRMFVPALVIGWVWPYALPRASLWFLPLAVLLVGGVLTVLLSLDDLPSGGTGNAQAPPTQTALAG